MSHPKKTGTAITFTAASPEEMLDCGKAIAAELPPGAVALLIGEMGAGKTTLAKGIVEGFGAGSADDVSSPTFTLVHEYRDRRRAFHLDLYRLETPQQVRGIGVDEMLDELIDGPSANDAICLVEWGERFPALWPEDRFEIRIELDGETRRITLVPPPST